jgi:hypothetical protein
MADFAEYVPFDRFHFIYPRMKKISISVQVAPAHSFFCSFFLVLINVSSLYARIFDSETLVLLLIHHNFTK